jgi:outer membrane protein TolC
LKPVAPTAIGALALACALATVPAAAQPAPAPTSTPPPAAQATSAPAQAPAPGQTSPPPSPAPPPPAAAPFEPAPRHSEKAGLDGHETVVFALAHEPSLLAQRATVLNLDATYTKMRAGEFPTLSGELQNQIAKSANQSGQFAQFGLSPASNFSQNTAELSTSYNLYNATQQLDAEQAKKQVDNARDELRRQEEAAAINVTNAFYALAADHGVVALDENDLRYQQELLDAARAEEHVGRVAGVDVLRAQVAVARSESALVQARTTEANDRESLAVLIGAPTDTPFDVPAVLPEPAQPATETTTLNAIAAQNRPEISEARAAFDAAKLGDAAVDNDLRPTVALNGSFGSQVSPTNFVLQQEEIDQSNAQALASYQAEKQLFPGVNFAAPVLSPPVDRHQPGFWQFNITSTFQIPLYDYGQRAAQHHAARAQIESTNASLVNAYETVQADVQAARRNLDAASQKLELAKLSSREATESARIARLQYASGLISFTDVTQTEQTALGAQNDLLAARVQYVTAFVRLRVALAPPDTAAAADLRGL